MGDCVQCKVESGIIKERDEVILMPFNISVGIKAIEIFKKRVNYAFPGTICELVINLPTSFDPSYIKAGNVMCDPKYPVHQVKEFRSQIVVFDIDIPITRGQPVIIYSFSNRITGRIAKLEGIINPKSGETIKKNPK